MKLFPSKNIKYFFVRLHMKRDFRESVRFLGIEYTKLIQNSEFYAFLIIAKQITLHRLIFHKIISWKTTTKFMKRPGSLRNIFRKLRRNEMVEIKLLC